VDWIDAAGSPIGAVEKREGIQSSTLTYWNSLRPAIVGGNSRPTFSDPPFMTRLEVYLPASRYTPLGRLRGKLLLGHARLDSTVRYLGIEVDDALEISEQTEI
jgi:hypothetical protein